MIRAPFTTAPRRNPPTPGRDWTLDECRAEPDAEPAFPLTARLLNAPTPWYNRAEARRILADCVARPPRCEARFNTYVLTRDEYHVYAGARVEKLNAIYDAVGEAALAHGHETGDYTALRHWGDRTVTTELDALLSGRISPSMLSLVIVAIAQPASAADQGAIR
jgi:hypothetical protein